jgi:threonine dehydrogenase-like Zn-dependent dehydrogenase
MAYSQPDRKQSGWSSSGEHVPLHPAHPRLAAASRLKVTNARDSGWSKHEARGGAAKEKVLELTDGWGVDSSMECVGTAESIATAFGIVKARSMVGVVGVPHCGPPLSEVFFGAMDGRVVLPRLASTFPS